MEFFRKYREKRQFTKDLMIARIKNEPLEENVMSVIYSMHNDEMNLLVIERSNSNYLWPGMKQFGTMGKLNQHDPLLEILKISHDCIAPSINETAFQKAIKKIELSKELNFDLKEEFMNISSKVYLIEIDDYVLRSCRGFRNKEINNMYYINLRDILKQVQTTRIHYPEISKSIQPHYAHLFWFDKIHINIINNSLTNKKKFDLFEMF